MGKANRAWFAGRVGSSNIGAYRAWAVPVSELTKLGEVTSDLSAFQALSENVDLLIERAWSACCSTLQPTGREPYRRSY